LKLLTLPEDIQESYYATSHISKSVAEQIASKKDPNELRKAWEAATKEGMTVAAARAQKRPGGTRPPTSQTEIALHKTLALQDAMEGVSTDDPKYPDLRKALGNIASFVSLLEKRARDARHSPSLRPPKRRNAR
jgi:ParB-like chromosome segregation protein Spo0J